MENIIVVDNFLIQEELYKAIDIIKSSKWSYYHGDNSNENSTNRWILKLDDTDFFSIYVKNLIEKQFSKKFYLKRVYASGQTYGQNGIYHIDDCESDTFTFCLYLSQINNNDIETAGGNLYIKIPNENKFVASYEPYLNRGIFFPSTYLHKGSAFNRYIKEMRVCVAWKLLEIK
jgi:hypothetical protein